MTSKKLLTIALGLVLSIGASAQGILLLDNQPLADVLAQARKENKLVFVDCYTSWCGPCKRLAREVFPQKEAGDFFNPRFVSLKLDMEKGEGPELAKKWDVGAYPTLTFLNQDGEVMFQTLGARDVRHLVDTVAYLLEHHRPSELATRYRQGDRSPQLVMDYIAELQQLRKSRTATEVAADFASSRRELLVSDTLAQQLLARYISDPHNEGFLYAYEHRSLLPSNIVESLENTWRMFTKTFYIMGGNSLSIDEEGMRAYYEFMMSKGVEKALRYYMSYKLPASFIMKDKRMMLECLTLCRGLEGIPQGQINMALNELGKQTLTKEEKELLDKLKNDYTPKQ